MTSKASILAIAVALAAGLSACGGGETNEAANVGAGNDGMAMNTLAANEALAVDVNNAAADNGAAGEVAEPGLEGEAVPPGTPPPPPPPPAPRVEPQPKAKAKAPPKAKVTEPTKEDDPHAGHDMNNMSH